MNRLLRALALLVLPTVANAAEPMLTWHGQSCFELHSAGGADILIDPIPGSIGYTLPPAIKADVITISHEHPDHNNVSLAQGSPKVLRGLTEGAKDWNKVDEKVKDVHIRNVGVYHDDKQGAERGKNSVFIYEMKGLTVAHMGDLGHLLTPEQLKAMGKVDVLLLPVGGVYTIDGPTAWKVVEQVKPRWVVVPMHYKTEALKIPLATADGFLAGKPNVKRPGTNTLKLSKPAKVPEIIVLSWK